MKISNNEILPDRIPTKELEKLFCKLIKKIEKKQICEKKFLEEVTVLMDRQVMTYELLNDKIRKKLDNKISEMWDISDYDKVDTILSLVVNLGLQDTYTKIKKSLKESNNISSETLSEIQEVIEECGEDVSNPYKKLEESIKGNKT